MRADYSWVLVLAPGRIAAALEALRGACDPDDYAALEALAAGTRAQSAITVLVADEPAWADFCADHPAARRAGGSVAAGRIHCWLEREPEVRLTLWPATRQLQAACLAARGFAAVLASILAAGGVAGYLDDGCGGLAPFWPL